MLLPTLPWGCTGRGLGGGEHPQLSLPQGQELAGGCTVALGSSAHPCSQPWEHGQMCSRQPCPHHHNRAVLPSPPCAVTPCRSLPHHQTSTSVPRACTTAASSAPTPLGRTPATAARASAPLIPLPASAWVSTCRRWGWQHPVPTHLPVPGTAVLPWEQGCCFLGCPVVLTAPVLANPKHRGQGGQTVAVQELME